MQHLTFLADTSRAPPDLPGPALGPHAQPRPSPSVSALPPHTKGQVLWSQAQERGGLACITALASGRGMGMGRAGTEGGRQLSGLCLLQGQGLGTQKT